MPRVASDVNHRKRPRHPVPAPVRCVSHQRPGSGLEERFDESVDVVFVVVEVNREAEVAVARGARDVALFQLGEELGRVNAAEWHRDDSAVIRAGSSTGGRAAR